MTKVMLLGLTSGEQIIAKIPEGYDFSDHQIKVKNPAILVPQDKGLGMAPWLLYTTAETEGVMINSNMVVFVGEPRPEISEQYNAIYGNGLVVPSTKKVESPSLKLVD